MTPPFVSIESAASSYAEVRPSELNFDQLHRHIVIALGFYDKPLSAQEIRDTLSPASVQSLDRHCDGLNFHGKRPDSNRQQLTMAYIDYYFGRFSAVTKYQYGDQSGYVLSEAGQQQCTGYLQQHVDGMFPLAELPIMVQQLAQPTTIETHEQACPFPETEPADNSMVHSVGAFALAPVRPA